MAHIVLVQQRVYPMMQGPVGPGKGVDLVLIFQKINNQLYDLIRKIKKGHCYGVERGVVESKPGNIKESPRLLFWWFPALFQGNG